MVEIGSAEFILSADSARLLGDLAKAEKATRDSANRQAEAIAKANAVSVADVKRAVATKIAEEKRAADAAVAAARKIEDAQKKSSSGFAEGIKGAAGFSAALLGIGTAATTAAAGIKFIGDETQKANQAQFALAATFKNTSQVYTDSIAAQAAATKKTTAEVKEAVVAFGSLGNRYAVDASQIKELTSLSADLAAVKGITTVEAAKRLEAALRGEAESAEFLGLTLNSDYLKKFAVMSDLQRKNWETLDPLIKAQITYREVLRQTADVQGKAAERANSDIGAVDRLATAWSNLAVTIGQKFAPAVSEAAKAAATGIEFLDEHAKAAERDRQAHEELRKELGLAANITQEMQDRKIVEIQQRERLARDFQQGLKTEGGFQGPTLAEAEENKKKLDRELAERKDAAKAELDAAEKAAKKALDIELDAIDKEKAAKGKWYDEERTRIEARRAYQLEDIEKRKDAALAGIQAEKVAAKDAADANIAGLEREKDARLAAAELARDLAEKSIEDEKRRLDRVRQIEDRSVSDARQQEDRSVSDRRLLEDREREKAQTQVIKGIEDERDARVAAIDEDIKQYQKASEQKLRAMDAEADKARANTEKAIRGIEAQADRARAASEKKIRGLEKEADAARDASEKAIRDIETLSDAEDERHRNAVQALEDEQDVRLNILDTQIKALDAQEKAEQSANRMADLQRKVGEAERNVSRARGSGTPEQIAAARQGLTSALLIGNPEAIQKAQRDLQELAGQGIEAVRKAEEELAQSQEELRQQGVDDTRDAERDKLDAKKAAIKEEIDGRKRVEDDQNRARKNELDAEKQNQQDILKATLARLDGEKQAEQDRLKGTLDKLDKRKQAEQDGLKASLDKIAQRKQAEQDAAKDELELLRNGLESEKKAAQESIETARSKYADQTNALKDARTEEDRQRDDRREKEDQDRQDFRAAEDEKLRIQREAVQLALADERKATEEHYNGPNGIITQAKAASEAQQREYSARLAAARVAFEEERKAAERVYQNPEKTGLLDLLAKAREDEFNKLEQSKDDWKKWQEDVSEKIKKAQGDLDAFVKSGASAPGSGDIPAVRSAGSGKNTVNSPALTKSGKSGKEVRGDLVTWINDAMDITGVPNDWLPGLMKLVQLESGGDPHNQNKEDVIDKNGNNLGKATGLLQTLPPTFQSFRDKDLPNDIYDPVANAVAAINYIKKRYGHVNEALKNHAANGGYDSGHLFTEPTLTVGTHSGKMAWIAEKRPELLVGGARTKSLLSGGYQPNYARVGDTMSSLRGDVVGGAVDNSTSITVNGVGLAEVAQQVGRIQAKRDLLRGVRRR